MTAASDLSPALIEGALQTTSLGRPVILLDACTSTSDEVARRAREDAPEGLVVVAERQTGGRGRLGRTWHSPAGVNLYLSLLLRPGTPPWTIPPLTLLAGGVLAETLASVGVAPRLKWPNDLQLDTEQGPRKLAGILIEMATERNRVRHVVVGIGLNVHAQQFPAELASRATCLASHTGRTFDRGELLCAFLNAFEPAYRSYVTDGPAGGLARWRVYARLGERCRIDRDGAVLEGVALDVDPDGALRVRDDRGQIHRVVSGEVLDAPGGTGT